MHSGLRVTRVGYPVSDRAKASVESAKQAGGSLEAARSFGGTGFVHRLTEFSLAHPKLSLAILLAITIGLGAGAPKVQSAFGYRVLIGSEHPSMVGLDEMVDTFGGGFPIVIAWECGPSLPCESALDQTSLEMARQLSDDLIRAPGVQRVESIATAPLIIPSEDGFAIRRLVENERLPADIDALRERALEDDMWTGTLVSEDGSVGTVIAQAASRDVETDEAVADAFLAAMKPHEEAGFEFYQIGDPLHYVVSGRNLAQSTSRLIPFTVALIVIVVFVFCRSLAHTITSLATMGVAVLWTRGLMGWIGWPKDAIHEILTPLVLVVGVCDAIHVLAAYSARLGADLPRERAGRVAAMSEVCRDMAAPCVVTTLTTAAAFLSFTTSDLEAFTRLGVLAAFGVVACLILTFTLLPVVATFLPGAGSERATADGWRAGMSALVGFAEARAVALLAVASVLLAVAGYGWAERLQVDNNWMETFGHDSALSRSLRFLESHLRPSRNLEVSLRLPPGEHIASPASIETVLEVSRTLSETDGLGETRSVVDLIERINRTLHDDDPAYEKTAETLEGNAQLLELIGFEDADTLAAWLSLDQRDARISADAFDRPYQEKSRMIQHVRETILSDLPPGWEASFSGHAAIDNDWIGDVRATQVRSFPTALALVIAILAVYLRSLRLAAAALVPTVFPVVMVLGTMGWLGLNLDVGRAMIAAVLIGISVDDAVHILLRYKQARENGSGPRAAIRHAVRVTGRAVVTTSVALAIGFLTLMASAWQSISSFGFYIAIGIMAALVASLFVLPALIFVFNPEEEPEKQ